MDTAMIVRANITRTWDDRAEMHMGDCNSMVLTEEYMLECPTDNEFTTCVRISNGNVLLLRGTHLTSMLVSIDGHV